MTEDVNVIVRCGMRSAVVAATRARKSTAAHKPPLDFGALFKRDMLREMPREKREN